MTLTKEEIATAIQKLTDDELHVSIDAAYELAESLNDYDHVRQPDCAEAAADVLGIILNFLRNT